MSKAVLVMDMPENCMKCPMVNSSDERILQDEDANFAADTWEDLKAGCPLVELPEKIPEPKEGYETIEESVKRVGWNACIDKMLGR